MFGEIKDAVILISLILWGIYGWLNLEKCEQLENLLKNEIPALKIAYLHRQLDLSNFVETKVSYKVAEKNFNEKYMQSFAEGYKLCFCLNVCPDRDNCKIKESEDMYRKKLIEKYGENGK